MTTLPERRAPETRAEVTLPSTTDILITRDFAAPLALVYRAWTTPDLVRRWWSADMGQTTHAEIDLQVGGRWRYVMVTAGGQEVGFHGVYREIVPETRLVATEIYEGMPDSEGALNTVTFAPHGNGTRLTILVQHAAQADRDAHLHSGMETGMQKTLAWLDDVALSLA
ncbi:ATPase [Deinococcus sp. HMF7620]|uniref:ATPase n=1 Tax=Deinococcus arboris TaxID=2682977 RepID=A0A7C9HPA5_9DEIO|nr:SRPBCC family protein [Deinococcus arboris]MVN85189.1 ATPase [Deinococcus arboris]